MNLKKCRPSFFLRPEEWRIYYFLEAENKIVVDTAVIKFLEYFEYCDEYLNEMNITFQVFFNFETITEKINVLPGLNEVEYTPNTLEKILKTDVSIKFQLKNFKN